MRGFLVSAVRAHEFFLAMHSQGRIPFSGAGHLGGPEPDPVAIENLGLNFSTIPTGRKIWTLEIRFLPATRADVMCGMAIPLPGKDS